MRYIKEHIKTIIKSIIAFIVIACVVSIIVNYFAFKLEFWDNGSKGWDFWNDNPSRGSVAIEKDLFGEKHKTPEYLDQGWSERESLWFYNTSQGSNLLPYDFFMVLEQKDSEKLFRDSNNMAKYRYLPQQKTLSNPDALPVGFAKDSYKIKGEDDSKEYLGLTCAACHTSQINYKKDGVNHAIRIDGGPAQSDMNQFMVDLGEALMKTFKNDEKRERFVKNILNFNNENLIFTSSDSYDTKSEVIKDLEKFAHQIQDYNQINHSTTEYGYMRLDAFGRIYNRVAKNIIDEKTLRRILGSIENLEVDKLFKDIYKDNSEKTHLVGRILLQLGKIDSSLGTNYKQTLLNNMKLFNKSNAPVSYPFLWGTPQHDYVQWNGIGDNSGLGALGRNVGQVIGVFATLDWGEETGFSVSSLLDSVSISKKLGSKHINYQSSVNVRNLVRIEDQLTRLQPPKWNRKLFGQLNKNKKHKGKKIYKKYCQECHAVFNKDERDNPNRKITAHFSSLDKIKTDKSMATNAIERKGFAGFVRHQYVDTPVGKKIVHHKAPVAELLTLSAASVVATPNYDNNFIIRWSDWVYDLFFSFFTNSIEATIKIGDYNSSTTSKPYDSLLVYKARPLHGIWATAPYLHNGSVPTLYDLLLPKKLKNDTKCDESYRPDKFIVGSRIFDTKKVGFKSQNYKGFEFDTSLPGNSNAGHEYATGCTIQVNGEVLPVLNMEQRLDLLEYLKSL
jgi:cytochrome c1